MTLRYLDFNVIHCYYILSGAVKITPAHDHNDYDCGKRHNLDFVTVIDDSGNMTSDCGEFSVYQLIFYCSYFVPTATNLPSFTVNR